jgi:hypothetical protein
LIEFERVVTDDSSALVWVGKSCFAEAPSGHRLLGIVASLIIHGGG